MTRALSSFAVVLLLVLTPIGAQKAAAQDTEPPPPPVDPVGAWDFAITFDGQEMYGLLTIAGSADEGYTGGIDTEMGGASVTDIAIEGQTMTFKVPDAEATAVLVFEGAAFEGSMSGAMGEVEFWGTKREGG